MRNRFALFAAVIALLLAASSLIGQVSTSSIFGRVTDASGAAVPNVPVTVTNTATNFTRTVATNEEGEYRVEFLPVGEYTVEVAAAGFKKSVQKGIALAVNVPARADAALIVGVVSESVNVDASSPLVNTSNAQIGRTVSNDE
ncbi:MAG: carboxypeptidase-like regulatory domain-containing protein, partial [Bryobacteraceae bacterium]